MGYLRDHWRGRHALPWAFWINFLLPFVLIAMAEPWIRPAATGGTVTQAVLAALYILLTHAVILPWQIVGLWRSSRRHLEERGDIVVVTFAQAAILVALVTATGATTTTVQRIFGFGTGGDIEIADAAPRYVLKVLAEDRDVFRKDHGVLRQGRGVLRKDRAILIDGRFDLGLSRDLKSLLAETPDIDAIILNSDGGRIFEARGVAKQIVERNLDTYVFGHCRSACTIAFIAGSTRMLGESGQLGFHSYRLDGIAAFTDPLDEQAKDRSFFTRQGVQPDFIARAFETPHEDMWHPDADRLLGSGVVDQVVEDR